MFVNEYTGDVEDEERVSDDFCGMKAHSFCVFLFTQC